MECSTVVANPLIMAEHHALLARPNWRVPSSLQMIVPFALAANCPIASTSSRAYSISNPCPLASLSLLQLQSFRMLPAASPHSLSWLDNLVAFPARM